MELKTCKTCKKDSIIGVDIIGVHICNDCVDSIRTLEVGEANYDYYKDAIKDAWKDYYDVEVN